MTQPRERRNERGGRPGVRSDFSRPTTARRTEHGCVFGCIFLGCIFFGCIFIGSAIRASTAAQNNN